MSKELEELEKKFEEKTFEMLVLLKRSLNGAMVVGDYFKPTIPFIASVNLETGELRQEEGIMIWLVKQKKLFGPRYGYDFKKMQICRVLVRKGIPVESKDHLTAHANNQYLLVKVLDKNVEEERLEQIREEYQKPVYVDNEIGHFELERDWDHFMGEINWLGDSCSVYLNVGPGTVAGDMQFNQLKDVVADKENWDHKIRTFAASNLTESANDWQAQRESEAEEITEEQFIKRITMIELTIDIDGSMAAVFSDDDMFWGHWIVVRIDSDGNLEDVDIEG